MTATNQAKTEALNLVRRATRNFLIAENIGDTILCNREEVYAAYRKSRRDALKVGCTQAEIHAAMKRKADAMLSVFTRYQHRMMAWTSQRRGV